MARNIEIKARVPQGLAALEARVQPLAGHGPELLLQDDTFFQCAAGRLKLREFADGTAELIAYSRPDQGGPKLSDFIRTPVPEPAGLRAALQASNGLRGRVRKRRTLYLVGRTRVHLDRVDGLGEFVELEVMLADGESAAAGTAEAQALMARLAIAASDLLEGAYIDLLEEKSIAKGPAP